MEEFLQEILAAFFCDIRNQNWPTQKANSLVIKLYTSQNFQHS